MKQLTKLLTVLTLVAMTTMATRAISQEPGFTDSGLPIESATPSITSPGDPPLTMFGEHLNALSTIFTAGNSFAGNMFDVEVTGSAIVNIEGFDIHLTGISSTVSVYYREGSYMGHESSAVGWTLAGTQSNVVPVGLGNPTQLSIGDIVLVPGQVYGFYITVSSYPTASMHYTNGTGVYNDDHLQITAGIGKGTPDFTGNTFDPRIWNGTIYYSLNEPMPTPLSGWSFWILGGLITLFVLHRSRRIFL